MPVATLVVLERIHVNVTMIASLCVSVREIQTEFGCHIHEQNSNYGFEEAPLTDAKPCDLQEGLHLRSSHVAYCKHHSTRLHSDANFKPSKPLGSVIRTRQHQDRARQLKFDGDDGRSLE